MNKFDEDMDAIENIREAKKSKPDLKKVLNKKNFDPFELDLLMNEAE